MEDNLLEISGDKIDGGELVGQRPDHVNSKSLCLNFSAHKPMQAIRQKCLDLLLRAIAGWGEEVAVAHKICSNRWPSSGSALKIHILRKRVQSFSEEE